MPTEPLTLSKEEIEAMTGLRQYTAQARALTRLKIPHQRRTIDGSLIVGREAARAALAGVPTQRDPAMPAANDDDEGFNWSVRA
ncbi:DUF4224 domain-containing protein [Variovorax sp. LjRoot130]|uniref:DUF4224 domain-containing protein n=1 Tax=Variovorax sp. LjRoot130 TaxID=3342261 RepID=UPI003ECEC7E6